MNVSHALADNAGLGLPSRSADDEYGLRQKASWDQKDFEDLFQQQTAVGPSHASNAEMQTTTPSTSPAMPQKDVIAQDTSIPITLWVVSESRSGSAAKDPNALEVGSVKGELSLDGVPLFEVEAMPCNAGSQEVTVSGLKRDPIDDSASTDLGERRVHVTIQQQAAQISIRDTSLATPETHEGLASAIRVELAYHGLTLAGLKVNGKAAANSDAAASTGTDEDSGFNPNPELKMIEGAKRHVR